ncbi:hypothetical protein HHI36_004558 [Cryptolaemus montrouzieri]|uniref:Methyltransferase type 11 domain-containing protein n=2 Tax=Cryptolaemus montrouzieri TaxID=559131 RepID=A0ABD2NT43_9CUCU
MMNALKYSKHATYHLEVIRDIYRNYIPSMNILKNTPFSAMDIGCGSGEVSLKVLHPLLPKNLVKLTGIDNDISMIERCEHLDVESNISFQLMDISSKNLPEEMKRSYDVLFSSYCFTGVRNLRQGLRNSYDILKPDGELLFVFMYKKNYLFSTYRKMSRLHLWKTLLEEYANFVPHFCEDNPELKLKELFEEAGLSILRYEFRSNLNLESTAKAILEVYKSLDTIHPRIPKDKRLLYMEDFNRIFSEETGINVMDETKLEEVIQMNFPTVIVHAKREDVKRK